MISSKISLYPSYFSRASVTKVPASSCPVCGQPPQTESAQNQHNGKETKEINENKLTDEEKRQVEKLKKTDREVRAHESAHMSAGAGLVRSGANFQYTTGPDGKQYAVGGEVSIDTSPVPDDPQATIIKMQRVQQAALAPAKPSGQDHRVAAEAAAKAASARQELNKQKTEESNALNNSDKTRRVKHFTTYDKSGNSQVKPEASLSKTGALLDLVV